MSELNQKPQENRKEQTQKIMGVKDKIDERRYQVYLMDLQCINNNEIADKLGVSLSTIEKDLYHMRYFCVKWYKDVMDSSTKSFLDLYNQIDIVQAELWKMYRKETDVNVKKRILDSIVSNSIKKNKGFKGMSCYSEVWYARQREIIGNPD